MDKDKIYVIGHKNPDTDSICSAIGYAEYLNQKKPFEGKVAVAARAGELNSETKFVLEYFKVPEPELISCAEGYKLILMDHNERRQIVDCFEKAEILGVVGHHRVSFDYAKPIFFHTEPVGSTATIVARKFIDESISLKPATCGILLSAILSDTVIFKSSTTTSKDIYTAEQLAKLSGIPNIEVFGFELKKRATVPVDDVHEVIYKDFKEYEFAGKKVAISQIETVSLPTMLKDLGKLKTALEKVYQDGRLDLVILMITDIMTVGSQIVAIGETAYLERAFNKKLDNNGSFYLPEVMSRKKDLTPPLLTAFSS